MLAAAVIVLLLGIGASWAAGRGGVDFPSLYVIGRGVLTGTNIYAPGATADFPTVYGVDQPMGMFYPPATGFTMLPFAMLPYGVAKFLWFVVMDLVLVLGVRQLVRVAAPRAETRVWVFCAGVILLSSTLRWSMILLQGAPLVFGLLCLFIAAEHDERPRLATALAVLAVAVKMTLTAPGCGMGTVIAGDAQQKILMMDGVEEASVEIVWDPPWHQSMITAEGRRLLGLE